MQKWESLAVWPVREAAQGTEVGAEVELAGGLDAREDTGHSGRS